MQSEPTSDLARSGLIVAGKFRLDSLIGRGGMGSVWSATHLGLGHQIAIKLVSREFVRSPAALRRFDAEAKAVARLQSRHVVQVYDNGALDDGTPYIAMELLSGESLQQRIDRAGPLSLRETVSILAQCCRALGRAHSMGIVHRDIKPDNIFLARTADEDAEVVKILDFGVAKVALSAGSESDQSVTKTGSVLGTPLYMSPEQARGLKSVDHRTDVYSLGLVAYTMLTGRDAFEGESFGDILIKICVEPLPRLSANANVPPLMDRWFEYVCARDLRERCGSAQEFVDTLRQASGINASGARAPEPAPIAPTITDSPPAPPRFAISVPSVANANMSMSAPGVPRRPVGLVVALLVGGLLIALGGVAFFVWPMHRGDGHQGPTAATAPPRAESALPSATSLAARPPEPIAPPPPLPALAETASGAPSSVTLAPLGNAPSANGLPSNAVADRHATAPNAPNAPAPTPHGIPQRTPVSVTPPTPAANVPAAPSKPSSPAKIDLGY
jgi:serine/threonine protein kinase